MATLRADLRLLLGRTDVVSRRAFGQGLGWKTGEEMVRLFLAGKTDIPLGKAAEWAEKCGAELRDRLRAREEGRTYIGSSC